MSIRNLLLSASGVSTGGPTLTWASDTKLQLTDWGPVSAITSSVWHSNKFVIGGAEGKSATSSDGLTWTYQNGLASLYGAGYGIQSLASNGTTVIAGTSGGQLASSANGIIWTDRSTSLQSTGWPSNGQVFGSCYANSLFVIVGYLGRTAYSANGITWIGSSRIGSFSWRDVCYGNSTFVAVGDNGTVMTSSNGASWTSNTELSSTTWGTNNAYSVIYGNGVFVAVGNSVACATSTNGTSWTYQSGLAASGMGTCYRIVFNGSYFVVAGSNGIATSFDGVSWTKQSGVTSFCRTAAYKPTATTKWAVFGTPATVFTATP